MLRMAGWHFVILYAPQTQMVFGFTPTPSCSHYFILFACLLFTVSN